ncbi:MAG: altronate dehydratase [Anaerolineae bacterium]|nr:altronate dehydratase [Anaerolineae bacterium]
MPDKIPAIQTHPNDDVIILLEDARAGDIAVTRAGIEQPLNAGIPRGHKAAVRAIAPGQPVRRYGQIIGFACTAIMPGDHVHTHNIDVGELAKDYAFGIDARPLAPAAAPRVFMGYARPDGRVGTRNTVLVIAVSNCAASVARQIAAAFDDEALRDYPNIDAVAPLVHWTGCSIGGESVTILRRTLGGFARHPNVGAYLLVGLGCEVCQVSELVTDQGLEGAPSVVIQDAGGVRPAVEAGIRAVRRLLPQVDANRRTEQPVSKLTVALECGGSDAYSGLTANPAAGAAADLVVRQGGAAVFSETPEIYGAEHLLTRRAVSEAVGRALVERVRWWEDYTARGQVSINANPSPGNKAGGLTTIYEKSLGAVSKAGSAPLMAVYQYAEPIQTRGLCFMDTPGNDALSTVGMVAGGANLIVFTTGRGSVFGLQPVPTVKVATNTPLYARMPGDMDIDAGRVISEGVSIEAMGAELFEKMLAVASGERSKGELAGVGKEEFVPWIPGALL